MGKIRLGFAMCGSFCTFEKALREAERLKESFALFPIMSETAASTDTRFGSAERFVKRLEAICGKRVIRSIAEAEPLGPENRIDALLIEPCTGNTAGKLSNGITDTCVTMAAKSVLRVNRPVVLALSSNDSLAAAGRNIGRLLNTKNIYFVPLGQDDPGKKPWSLSADFGKSKEAILAALQNQQLQPVFI